MIYIIDDKTERQKKLAAYLFDTKYQDSLVHIHTREALDEKKGSGMFREDSIICFHDSFFKNPKNRHPDKSHDVIKRDFIEKCTRDKIPLILFSGDFSGVTFQTDSVLSISVSAFYRNFPVFFENISDAENRLKYLAFGNNFKFEEIYPLKHKLHEAIAHENPNDTVDYDIIDRYIEPIYNVWLDSDKLDEETNNLKDFIDNKVLNYELLLNMIDVKIKKYLL